MKLSVIIPTYNRADTLEACLQAVRGSTFRDYELVVVDCGSQDASRDIARRYADRLVELKGIPSRSAALIPYSLAYGRYTASHRFKSAE